MFDTTSSRKGKAGLPLSRKEAVVQCLNSLLLQHVEPSAGTKTLASLHTQKEAILQKYPISTNYTFNRDMDDDVQLSHDGNIYNALEMPGYMGDVWAKSLIIQVCLMVTVLAVMVT